MKIHLQLFAVARDLAGFREKVVEIDAPASADSIIDILAGIDPRFGQWRTSLRLAVNLRYVPGDHILHEGDEVAVIPPVSGG